MIKKNLENFCKKWGCKLGKYPLFNLKMGDEDEEQEHRRILPPMGLKKLELVHLHSTKPTSLINHKVGPKMEGNWW